MVGLPPHDTTALPPRYGFGASGLGNLGRTVSRDDARATLEAAWNGGFRYYDTSPLYGYGLSELRLGDFLRDQPREAFTLSTKVGRYLVPPHGREIDTGLWQPPLELMPILDYGYDATMRSLEQSHSRLGLARFDIVYIHDIDRRNHGAAFGGQYRAAIEGAYRALAELKHAGVIRAIGIGVNEADVAADFMRDADLDLVMLAGRYTLLDFGSLDGCFETALDRRVGIVAVGIFNSGILAKGVGAGTFDYGAVPAEIAARAEQLTALAQRHAVPLAAAAAQFPLAHPAVRSVVLGMSRPANVERSIDNLGIAIPAAFWHEFRALDFVPDDVPVPAAR